jgi:hypothetical protein
LRDLGPAFADERLRETLVNYIGVGADSGQPPEVRFLRSVQNVVRKRISIEESDSPAVFLLNQSRQIPNGTRRMGMIDNGDKLLEGRIWYVGPSLGFARAIDHECGKDDIALFGKVVDELDQGSTPTVLFLPHIDRTSVRFYPFGLLREDEFETLSVEAQPVSLNEIFVTLDRLHEKQLVTPNAQSVGNKMWKDSEKFFPISNAELVAQSYVETALWARFSHCRVVVEVSQVSGRLDVALVGHDISAGAPSAPCYAVLELKVLRSFSEGGNPVADLFNKNWVKKGMQQAFSYAEEMRADAKALCCFDMRKTDTGDQCFAHVATEASTLNVVLKKWHLFGRLVDYRAAIVNDALSTSARQDDK